MVRVTKLQEKIFYFHILDSMRYSLKQVACSCRKRSKITEEESAMNHKESDIVDVA